MKMHLKSEKRTLRPARALSLSALLMLTACGFKPAGVADLPSDLQSVYVDVATDKPLATLTAKLIAQNGGKLVGKDVATTQVLISPMQRRERLVALSNNGAVKERERVYFATVRLVDRKSQVVTETRTLETRRFFQTDDTKKLSSPARERIVREAAMRELASDILRFLATFQQ